VSKRQAKQKPKPDGRELSPSALYR